MAHIRKIACIGCKAVVGLSKYAMAYVFSRIFDRPIPS
jgi:hypothetical protein